MKTFKQIRELSNKTLGRYIKKAARSSTDAGRTAGVSDMAGNSRAAMKGYDTLTKRQKGIDRAVDKMTRKRK